MRCFYFEPIPILTSTEKLDQFKPRPYWVRYCVHYFALFLGSIFTKTSISGKHNLPEKGPYILAANHFNIFDPPFVIYAIQKPISFLAASDIDFSFIEYLALWIYGFIPTNRSKLNPSTIKMSKKVLRENDILGIFPEGDTEHDKLRQPKSGVVYLSASSSAPIIPIGVYGLDKSLWHYLFKGVRPKITINIGKSFGPYKLPRNKEARESELIKIGDDVMCRLAALLPNDAHGVYAKNPKIEIYKKENE